MTRLRFGNHVLDVTVSSSPEELRRGLSGIRSLPRNKGMLFILPEVGPAHFWMRDTRIPLDIALLDANMKVRAIHTMEPGTGEVRDYGPIKYAVETNAGWFRQQGVRPGDFVVQGDGMSTDLITKLAKKNDSALRKALPVAGAAALPVLLGSRTAGLVGLPLLAGIGSVVLQRDDATLPFVAPMAGAFAGNRLAAAMVRRGMVARAAREEMPGLKTRTGRLPLSRVAHMGRVFPKTLAGRLLTGGAALGGALGAHIGNK